jgi:pyruvate dehydrogenase E2 component (dihydrolipoyllysine-residue acetyltransferase)
LADVVMPQLGETVTEGTVTRWFKSVGEHIDRDEPLFEVSTDKVDSEVPSPAEGVLSEIVVQEGETADVGTVLAVVSAEAGEPAAQSDAVRAAAPSQPAQAPPTEPVPPSAAQTAPAPPPAPVEAGGDGYAQPATRLLSPVVRRLLEENGIAASDVPGTGPGGRITRSDVLRVVDERREAGVGVAETPRRPPAPSPPVGTAASATPPAAVPVPSSFRAGTDEVVPFTNIRRRTAEHMVRSKATSAHTLVVLEADYEQVEKVRRARGDAFRSEEGFALTYLPFVARATVEALHEWPNLNSSVGEDSLILHHQCNLGIAVDLNHNGLIVPVVKNAEELTLRGMARRVRDLADRARTKKLSADDISGGTFSLTNAGPFGTLLTAPIINQPQVAILSTDAVKRRPVVVTQADGTEAIAIHSIGLLCLSWDHRAVDGAYAAAFLARVVEILSSHDWSAEL